MTNSADFESFLKDINPSKSTIDEASRLHRNLRDHLKASETYGAICKDTYLSGSYAKQTFIRPKKDSDSCDIDVIVETNHSINDSPFCVLLELEDALRERAGYKNVRVQTQSIGIDLANFQLDGVKTAFSTSVRKTIANGGRRIQKSISLGRLRLTKSSTGITSL